jgi:DNA-binding NarL/FixJ family response regulator
MNAVRILVVDPYYVVREGLKAILGSQPDMRVVGEAGDGPVALSLAAELAPDVVVLEAALPHLDGAQVIARLREACADRKVLVLTGCEDRGAVRLLLGMGARGYVLKRSRPDQLMRAVRAVATGGIYLDPDMADGVAGAPSGTGAEKPDAELSARECDVIRLIARGYSNKEIAAHLQVSVKTVETYKSRAMEKLRIRSRVDIVRFATRSGWLEDIDWPGLAVRVVSGSG